MMPKKKYTKTTIGVLLFFLACYLLYSEYRVTSLYQYIKANYRGIEGHIFQADSQLGLAPIPNSSGAEILLKIPNPVHFDQYGFRVPQAHQSSNNSGPRFLALGDSYTYGAVCKAEESFAHLIGKQLGGYTLNAGVSSYGLAQMLLLAQKLIPEHKPDYIMVQYSPWLISRAASPFGPSYFGKLPVPYFYEVGANFKIQPPAFKTKIFDLPLSTYRKSQRGVRDLFSFSLSSGLPLVFHDDTLSSFHSLKRTSGIVPSPTTHLEEMSTYVYKEIQQLAQKHQSRMFIIMIGAEHHPLTLSPSMAKLRIPTINAHAYLLSKIPSQERSRSSFLKHYGHWRGEPPELVDTHPNPHAHQMISQVVTGALNYRPNSEANPK